MFSVKFVDVKGEGGTYDVPNRLKLLPLIQRLVEHGTKYHGDKITEITITRQGRKSRQPIPADSGRSAVGLPGGLG